MREAKSYRSHYEIKRSSPYSGPFYPRATPMKDKIASVILAVVIGLMMAWLIMEWSITP
jgi:hypothetical protein